MKSTLITILVCHSTLLVYSQESQKQSYSIKMYNQISYVELNTKKLQSNKFYNHKNSKNLTFLNPSFAFQFKTTTGNSHEFELTNFRIVNSRIQETDSGYLNIVDGSNKTENNISFRYEYSSKSSLKINKSTSINLSYGVQPYFIRTSIKPYVSTIFPESEQYIGGIIYIAPRLTYTINEKFNLEINIPINLLDVNYYKQEIENPIFSKNQRTRTTVNFEGIPSNYNIRMGLVYKI